MEDSSSSRVGIVAFLAIVAVSSATMLWLFWRFPLMTAIGTLGVLAVLGVLARLARSIDVDLTSPHYSSAARPYLPMQKLLKISPSKSSLLNSPVISPNASCARRNSSAKSSKARVSVKI